MERRAGRRRPRWRTASAGSPTSRRARVAAPRAPKTTRSGAAGRRPTCTGSPSRAAAAGRRAAAAAAGRRASRRAAGTATAGHLDAELVHPRSYRSRRDRRCSRRRRPPSRTSTAERSRGGAGARRRGRSSTDDLAHAPFRRAARRAGRGGARPRRPSRRRRRSRWPPARRPGRRARRPPGARLGHRAPARRSDGQAVDDLDLVDVVGGVVGFGVHSARQHDVGRTGHARAPGGVPKTWSQ